MSTASKAVISVRGRFGIHAPDGRDLTPPLRKERALVAALAVSPQRRRTRSWLQGLLWSQHGPDQAAGNLRRVLCDLRRRLGPDDGIIGADRFDIWLTDAVTIDLRSDLCDRAELLEAVDAPDPAFEDWLRDLRAGDETPGVPTMSARTTYTGPGSGSDTIIVIQPPDLGCDPDAAFLARLLTDAFTCRLDSEGAAEIYIGAEPSAARLDRAGTILRIELSAVANGGSWDVHLRALADRDRRFLWSGRFRLAADVRRGVDGSEIAAFVSTSLSQIHARFCAYRLPHRSIFMAMHRAATRMYTADFGELCRAEADLVKLSDGDGAAMALGWRAFACVTRAHEFGETGSDLAQQAEELARDALARRPDASLVAALAARVALELSGDVERAHHLARTAMRASDEIPHALYVTAQVALMQGRMGDAHAAALRGRLTAEGLPYAFAWDMEIFLTALGVGDLDLSYRSARAAHAQNRSYRPALRYLVALDLLRGNDEEARIHAARLRDAEPGFVLSDLRRADYPMMTLRRTGYMESLPV